MRYVPAGQMVMGMVLGQGFMMHRVMLWSEYITDK